MPTFLLSWTPATTLGPRFETYKVYRAQSEDGQTFSDYAEVFEGAIVYDDFMAIIEEALEYEDSDVEEYLYYRYYVVALDVYERGVQSNIIEMRETSYRITEDDLIRQLEDDDLRIVE